jgi:hypothetical protein
MDIKDALTLAQFKALLWPVALAKAVHTAYLGSLGR